MAHLGCNVQRWSVWFSLQKETTCEKVRCNTFVIETRTKI